jgi:hypothetical protein
MPYRRLPNTDNARLKALKKALEMAETLQPNDLAFNYQLIPQLKSIIASFEQMFHQQKQAIAIQSAKSKELAVYAKKAKMYISHFFQVLNMAILRGEMPTAARKFYGLKEDENKIPNLLTDKDIVYWGEQLLKGERERLAKMGGNPMTNPTAAVVRVRYEQFLEALHQQKIYQKSTRYATEKIAELRNEVDELILKIWNEVENFYSYLPENERRSVCSKYGIVYVWRPYERAKEDDTKLADDAELTKLINNKRKQKLQEEEQDSENRLQYSLSLFGN